MKSDIVPANMSSLLPRIGNFLFPVDVWGSETTRKVVSIVVPSTIISGTIGFMGSYKLATEKYVDCVKKIVNKGE